MPHLARPQFWPRRTADVRAMQQALQALQLLTRPSCGWWPRGIFGVEELPVPRTRRHGDRGTPDKLGKPPWLTPCDGDACSRCCQCDAPAASTHSDEEREPQQHSLTITTREDASADARLPWQQLTPPPRLSPRERPGASEEPQQQCPTVVCSADLSDEPQLPWQQLSPPPRLSPRERPNALKLDDEPREEEEQPEQPKAPAKCCDVCFCLYSGAICRCAQLTLTHPITKILARACISIVEQPLSLIDASPRRCLWRYDWNDDPCARLEA